MSSSTSHPDPPAPLPALDSDSQPYPSATELWPYPHDILPSLAPHLPTRTLALLCRVNSTFQEAFTPHLYRTMIVNDMHRGLRLRRALRLPSSTSYTRVLLIDAQHSCDECHAAGSPNLPNVQRLVLSFERAAFLQKESSWPDDPCRTLTRVRPETIVVRAHHQLMPDVLAVLRMHMGETVVRGAKRIVCVASLAPARFRNVTGRLFKPRQWLDAIADEGLTADITQIILPPPTPPSATSDKDQTHNLLDGYFTYHLFWRRVGLMADMVAEYPPNIRFTLVGLDGVGRPTPGGPGVRPGAPGTTSASAGTAPLGEEGVSGAEGEARADAVAGAGEAEGQGAEEADGSSIDTSGLEHEDTAEEDFRHRVESRMRTLAEAKGDSSEEELVKAIRARQEAIAFMSLREYMLTHDWEGEVPLAVAAEVLAEGSSH